jgi:hypothetical protein
MAAATPALAALNVEGEGLLGSLIHHGAGFIVHTDGEEGFGRFVLRGEAVEVESALWILAHEDVFLVSTLVVRLGVCALDDAGFESIGRGGTGPAASLPVGGLAGSIQRPS